MEQQQLLNVMEYLFHRDGIIQRKPKFSSKIFIDSKQQIIIQMFLSNQSFEGYHLVVILISLFSPSLFLVFIQPLQRDNEIITAEDDQEFLTRLQLTLNRAASPGKAVRQSQSSFSLFIFDVHV